MAVYEQLYRPYGGVLTPGWSRFLVLPRHVFRGIFQSKLLTAFCALSFVPTLVFAILIYLHYNVNALALLRVRVDELIQIDALFFRTYLGIQSFFAFLLTVVIGPTLIARDTANNALPLYLCRPFSRVEYVAGKLSVLLLLLSAITWVPGLLLFLFQSYLAGANWFRPHLWLAGAIFAGSMIGIFTFALLVLAISAWVRWRLAASAAFFGLFMIPAVVGNIVNELFLTRWGNMLNIGAQLDTILNGLFGLYVRRTSWRGEGGGRALQALSDPPIWSAWVVVALVCACCLFLLTRKVRAYEVFR